MLPEKYQAFIALLGAENPQENARIALCMKLLSTTERIDRSCALLLDNYHLSESRLLVLMLLREHGALSPLQVAEMSGVTKATMTQQIRVLLKDGYITKVDVPEDKRKYRIELTPIGSEIIASAFTTHTTWIQALTSALSTDEMDQLDHILNKILHSVEQL